MSRSRVAERDRRGDGLNLARQPFRNLRPIVRLAVLLWLFGGGLLVVNAVQYWGYFTGSEDRRAELEQLQGQVEEHRQDIEDLEARFRSLDLRRQNAEVRFLNHKIGERAFSWSGLFDRLADVLPNDVRLVSLSPETERRESGRSRRSAGDDDLAEGEIRLGIIGVARTPEAQLEFIEALFAHPAFRAPDLSRDSVSDGQIRFDMTTVYLPDGPALAEESTEVAEAEAAEAEVAAEDESTEEAQPVESAHRVESSSGPSTERASTDATPAQNRAASPAAPAATQPPGGAGATSATLRSTSQPSASQPSTSQPSTSRASVDAPSLTAPAAPRRPVGPVLQPRAPSAGTSRASALASSANPANRPLPRQPNASSSPGIR